MVLGVGEVDECMHAGWALGKGLAGVCLHMERLSEHH